MDKLTERAVFLQTIAGMAVLAIGVLLIKTIHKPSMEILILALFFALSSLVIYFVGKRSRFQGSYLYTLLGVILGVGIYYIENTVLNFINVSRS